MKSTKPGTFNGVGIGLLVDRIRLLNRTAAAIPARAVFATPVDGEVRRRRGRMTV